MTAALAKAKAYETLAYWQEHASDYFPALAAASVTIAAMFGDMGHLYAADIRRLADTEGSDNARRGFPHDDVCPPSACHLSA